MKNVKSIALAFVVAGGLVGCTPKVLLTNHFLEPDGWAGQTKVTKSYIIPRTDDNKQFDYFVRVCDDKQGAKGFEVANCKDTLVVDHILR